MDISKLYSLSTEKKTSPSSKSHLFISPELLKHFPEQGIATRPTIKALRISNFTKKNVWSKFTPRRLPTERYGTALPSEASSFDAEAFELFSPTKLETDFAVSANIFEKREDRVEEENLISNFLESKTHRTPYKSKQIYIIKGIETISSLCSQVDYEQSNELIENLNKNLRKKNENLTSCTCTKSHCLKEYCNCYKNGFGCNLNCKCVECCNKYQKVAERKKKKIGCSCAHSQCLKKYCECYRRRKKCKGCKCQNCKNF